MITIYHLSTSRSERIVWLMEELGLEYQLEKHQREPNGAAPAAMKAIHAIGKAPIIRDGDTVLAESGAIVDYIVSPPRTWAALRAAPGAGICALHLLAAFRRGKPHVAHADRAGALARSGGER
jgi:glutathione S-transferase